MPDPIRPPIHPQKRTVKKGDVEVSTFVHRDAFTHYAQPRDTYYTTNDLEKLLGVARRTTVLWCEQWFGKLSPERRGKGMGYRIPKHYLPVVKFWMICRNATHRTAVTPYLLADPRVWVAVAELEVEKVSSCQVSLHYNMMAAQEHVEKIMPLVLQRRASLHLYYIGTGKEEQG